MSQKYTRAFQQTKVTGREMRDSWQTHAHTLRGRALWERTGELIRNRPMHGDVSIHQINTFCLWYFHFPFVFPKHPCGKQSDGFKTAVVKILTFFSDVEDCFFGVFLQDFFVLRSWNSTGRLVVQPR